MTRQAALYLATADDVYAARLRVAGRPVAFRTLLAAVRVGAGRVGVPVALRSSDFDAALATSPRARGALVWLDSESALAPEPTLLLPAAALVPAGALARLLAAAPSTSRPASAWRTVSATEAVASLVGSPGTPIRSR